MSTQRVDGNNIINSDVSGITVRNSGNIIPSAVFPIAQTRQMIPSSLGDEVTLNGNKYNILNQIARSGEAEVFLVAVNGNHLVFKYYYSQFKPKDEVLVKLKGLRHPYIVALYDYGYHQDRFFEISEYAAGGTLMDSMPLTSLKGTKEIIEQTIEGLNYCHNHGIIHRDIKPENIFYRSAAKNEIALGDFGIASNVKEGEELVRTSMARTSLYAAPELFTNIQGKTTIEKSVDYYALGMTLLQLWFGRNPFEDIDEFGIMRLKSEGRILFPDLINEDVEKLIKGLITVNPRERWGYDEVRRWLSGDEVKVFYRTIQLDYKPYPFGFIDGEQVVVNNPKDLAVYLDKYPDKGEGHVYRNTIAKWVETIDPGLYNDLMDIVEKDYPKDKTAGLTKAIYILDPERSFRGVDKSKLRTQEEIAAHFEQNSEYYKNDLQNPNAAFYMFLESRNYKANANEYRNYFKIASPEAALNTLILKLQGTDNYIIGNYTIYQPEELLKVDDSTLSKIIGELSNINSKLSIWINCFKKLQPTLVKWHSLKRFDETTLRYALQQGFVCNGYAAYNTAEFQWLLKNYFHYFFFDDNAVHNRDEANYWLKNYLSSSLGQAVMDYLQSESYSDKEFIEMLGYVLGRYDETGTGIYELVEKLLPYIQNRKGLLNAIAEIHQLSIENYWTKTRGTTAVLFPECLKEYLSFVVRNLNSYPELFTQLTSRLDSSIRTNIRKDLEKITADEAQTESYRADLGKLVDKAQQMNLDLPYIGRYNNEQIFVNKQKQAIRQKNEKEKQEKLAFTKSEFDKIVKKQRDIYKSQTTTDKFKQSFYLNIAFSLTGIVFLLALFFINANRPVTIISLAAIALTGFLGHRIGNNLAVSLTRSRYDENIGGAIAGMYAGMIAGIYFRGYIPAIHELAGFRVDWTLPIEILMLLVFLILAIFGGRAYFFIRKNNKAVNAIQLPAREQEALDENQKEIDRYYKEKETFENFQETARIITLNDRQFDMEFAKLK